MINQPAKKKLDAIIITDAVPFVFNGVADYTFLLAQRLIANNKSVDVYCRKAIFKSNVDYYFPEIPNWKFKGLIKLAQILLKKRPTWLWVQYEPYSFSSLGAPFLLIPLFAYARLIGIKIHTNFHEIAIRPIGNGVIGFFRSISQRVIAFFLAFISNRIITSNKYYQSILNPINSKVIFIPSNFEDYISKDFTPTRILTNNLSIVVNANRCSNLFFKMISFLSNYSDVSIQVIIVGRAAQNDINRINQMKKQYGFNTLFTFLVNEEPSKLIHTLQNADFYVQLEDVNKQNQGGISTKSGVVATAMMLGLPVISTIGDLTDDLVYKDGSNILFVDSSKPNEIAKKVYDIFLNEVSYKSISNTSIDSYWNLFSWEHTTTYYLNLLNS